MQVCVPDKESEKEKRPSEDGACVLCLALVWEALVPDNYSLCGWILIVCVAEYESFCTQSDDVHHYIRSIQPHPR